MPRPVSIQDEVILRAAREIFLAKGLDATTSEIAAKAGVSHGIIFKRFKTKQALFQSAMQEQADWGQTIAELLNSNLGRNDVQTTLCDVGSVFVQKFLTLIPTLMMSWSHKPENVSGADQAAAVGKARAAQALKAVKTIASYLEAESRLGRIRNIDFEVVAQAFVGALWHHSFLQVMLTDGRTGAAKERRYVQRLVQSLWVGLEPEAKPKTRGNS
jgi:AcrR family transcriptional regulator